MSVITQIEDALIDKIKSVLGNRVRTVEWAPPDWDEDFIKRALLAAPGVFVVFGGGSRSNATDQSVLMDTEWSVIAFTHHVQEAKQRARGDGRVIGCYDMLELLAPELDGFSPANAGTLHLTGWTNTAALKLEKQALMAQELSFALPNIELARDLTGSDLVPFLTYHDTFNVGQLAGAPPTEDTVELPQ